MTEKILKTRKNGMLALISFIFLYLLAIVLVIFGAVEAPPLMLLGILWAIPFLLRGHGLSTAALMAVIAGLLLMMMGLLAEQLAQIRKKDL